jgi:hypothetical protein
MAFVDQAALASDTSFLARVRVAVVTAATQIMGEDKAAADDVVFAKRQALAGDALTTAGLSVLQAFAWAVVANPSIVTGSTDSDIQFTINAVWNDIARVRSTD